MDDGARRCVNHAMGNNASALLGAPVVCAGRETMDLRTIGDAVDLHAQSVAGKPRCLNGGTRGTVLAITPFTLLYVVPYLLGAMPSVGMKVSVLSLGLLPLTFGYAIFRYRLMDVDLIFKRGMAYTLAAAAIVGVYFAGVAAIAELVHARVPSSGPYGLVLAVVVTALLFDPVRKWIQDKLDQFFYRTRYDYRRTLIEFGREMSSETDLDKMLASVVDRLARTLMVDRVAIFLANNDSSRFELARSFGLAHVTGLDLSFLTKTRIEDAAGQLHPAARSKKVTVVRDLTPVQVIGDGPALGQVALNLIANAVKYNRSGGRVWVR